MTKEFKTFKFMKSTWANCFVIPSICNLKDSLFLLNCTPFYHAGVYGWNCDFITDYETDTCVAYGNRIPFSFGPFLNVELCKSFETRALEFINNYPKTIDYEKLQLELLKLQKEFFKKISDPSEINKLI